MSFRFNYEDFLLEDIGSQDFIKKMIDSYSPDRVWLASDWHLYKSEVTVEQKEQSKFDLERIIIQQKLMVKPNDLFIYLGDLAHKNCGPEYYEKIRNAYSKLNGIKILIRGNHDIESDDFYLSCGFNYIFNTLQYKNIVFSHRPINLKDFPKAKINIHGHLHEHKGYFDGKTDLKGYLGVYDKKMKPIKLSTIIDNKKEIESENIDIYKEPERHMSIYTKETHNYDVIVKRFFMQHPEYKNLTIPQQYKIQNKAVKEFLQMKEVMHDENLAGWSQIGCRSKNGWEHIKYKPCSASDYIHTIILNKDASIDIDLFPELIGYDKHIYSQGKNAVDYMWDHAIIFTMNPYRKAIIPQRFVDNYMQRNKIDIKKRLL